MKKYPKSSSFIYLNNKAINKSFTEEDYLAKEFETLSQAHFQTSQNITKFFNFALLIFSAPLGLLVIPSISETIPWMTLPWLWSAPKRILLPCHSSSMGAALGDGKWIFGGGNATGSDGIWPTGVFQAGAAAAMFGRVAHVYRLYEGEGHNLLLYLVCLTWSTRILDWSLFPFPILPPELCL